MDSINNRSLIIEKPNKEAINYFDDLLNNKIVPHDDKLKIGNRNVRLDKNSTYYDTIFNYIKNSKPDYVKYFDYYIDNIFINNFASSVGVKPIEILDDFLNGKKYQIKHNDNPIFKLYHEARFNLVVDTTTPISMPIYQLPNDSNRQILYLCDLSERNAETIYRYITIVLGIRLPKSCKKNQIYQIFLNELANGKHKISGKIKNISNNPNTYTYMYVNVDEYQDGIVDAWLEFVSQIKGNKNKNEFMRWIYSIFDEKDIDRRMLYIEGESGAGKSTVAETIAKFMQNINPDSVKTLSSIEDKFSLSNLEKARLLLYSDIEDDQLFYRRDIKNITGKDTVYIDKKNQDPYSAKLKCKILITSNYPPNIDKSLSHQVTRLLHIKVSKNKTRKYNKHEYEAKLEEQLPAFLKMCKTIYFRD